MRILTVRQPWAWAIIHGGKDVENRVRNVAGSYRGPVAIHVAMANAEFAPSETEADSTRVALKAAKDTHRGDVAEYERWPWCDHQGFILGVVDLVGVHNSTRAEVQHPTCWGPDEQLMDRGIGYCSPWAESGAHHLELANPRALSEPIPYKGALGLRTLPDDVADRIEAQLRSTEATR